MRVSPPSQRHRHRGLGWLTTSRPYTLGCFSPSSLSGTVQSGCSPSLISDHGIDPESHDDNINKNAQSHHLAVLQAGGLCRDHCKRLRAQGQGTTCKGFPPSHLQSVHLKGKEIVFSCTKEGRLDGLLRPATLEDGPMRQGH